MYVFHHKHSSKPTTSSIKIRGCKYYFFMFFFWKHDVNQCSRNWFVKTPIAELGLGWRTCGIHVFLCYSIEWLYSGLIRMMFTGTSLKPFRNQLIAFLKTSNILYTISKWLYQSNATIEILNLFKTLVIMILCHVVFKIFCHHRCSPAKINLFSLWKQWILLMVLRRKLHYYLSCHLNYAHCWHILMLLVHTYIWHLTLIVPETKNKICLL